MKINCADKLNKALTFANEKDKQDREDLRKSVFQAYQKLDEGGDIEEVKELLENVYQKLNSNGPISLTHSLAGCLERITRYEAVCRSRGDYDTEYVISPDFGAHTFFFSEQRIDGGTGLCGGIVYHGCPDDGYSENGSVSLNPQYGWQIHT